MKTILQQGWKKWPTFELDGPLLWVYECIHHYFLRNLSFFLFLKKWGKQFEMVRATKY